MKVSFGVAFQWLTMCYGVAMKIYSASFAFMIGMLFVVPVADLVHAQDDSKDDPNADIQKAVQHEFSDIPVMVSIARCESSYRQYDQDGSALRGGYGWMVGVYQIDTHIHGARARQMGMNIGTVKGNLAYARYLYLKDGTAPWLASSACWSKARPNCRLSRTGAHHARHIS